ncbi:MAG: respiratory nitrate reductase subunit gamma [Desulfobacteraceae bacterium]|nr:respiratory nitrate reductase subunit gamma [Desulfobacteraceae bacterium]
MNAKIWKGSGIACGILMLVLVTCVPLAAGIESDRRSGERPCLDCHGRSNINTNAGVMTSRAFCNECHSTPDCKRVVDGKPVSLNVSSKTFQESPHQYVACIHCHADVARSPHRTQSGAQCRDCHSVHGEGTARAPHLRVDCQACHFSSIFVRLNAKDNRIKLARINSEKQPIGLVDHSLNDLSDDQSCERCHNRQNTVGAPAAVLPGKSLLCIVCHPSPATVGHPIFWVALIILVGGALAMVRFWFIGSVQGEKESMHRKLGLVSESVWQTLFSRKIITLLRVMVFDILLQRRILKESVQRWSMHSLIFLAIMARFLLSLLTGLIFSIDPDGELALALIDKNNIYMAFIYDMLGISIFLGVLWAVTQRFIVKPTHVVTEIEDNLTLGLAGLLVVMGFLSTGARLLLTQIPPDVAVYSFIGFPVSKALGLLPLDWRRVYPYLWYIHAILGAVFIAYLPFGKLKHIFNVPLTYLIEELTGVKKEKRV